jgi:hypothetical protein
LVQRIASAIGAGGGRSAPGEDDPYRRRASDWVRLGAAVIGLAWLAVRTTTPTETAVTQAFKLFQSPGK